MLNYTINSFGELTIEDLYDIMVLRQEVFIVEQDCPYLDADRKDQPSTHILGHDGQGQLHAYSRLVPMGISYDHYNSIGRVITSQAYRGVGEGRRLMEVSITEMKRLYPAQPTKISAQVYALPFYRSLGFVEVGEEYLEDDIPHMAMILS